MNKVLVVDDNEMLVDLTVEYLSDAFEVMQAFNASQALSHIEEGFIPDLMFTDIIMPGPMDGRDLADVVGRKYPQIKIVFTTGWSDTVDLPYPLLVKPYELSEVSRLFNLLLDIS